MGKLIVDYGDKVETYSSRKIEKELRNRPVLYDRPEIDSFVEELAADERVQAITLEEFNLKHFQCQGANLKSLSFHNCQLVGDVKIQDVHSLVFEQCKFDEVFTCCCGSLFALADKICFHESRISNYDTIVLMATELVEVSDSNVRANFDLEINTPHLSSVESDMSCLYLTWNVESCDSSESNVYAKGEIEYFGIPVSRKGPRHFESWVKDNQDSFPELVEYYRLMRVAKFLEGRGDSLISQIRTMEIAREYQNHFQGVDGTNFQEVFSALEQPCSRSSKSDLEKETIPQLVKRITREK